MGIEFCDDLAIINVNQFKEKKKISIAKICLIFPQFYD